MKTQELRALGGPELAKELGQAYEALLRLRFRLATQQQPNHREMRKVRQQIARIKTILRERELGVG